MKSQNKIRSNQMESNVLKIEPTFNKKINDDQKNGAPQSNPSKGHYKQKSFYTIS